MEGLDISKIDFSQGQPPGDSEDAKINTNKEPSKIIQWMFYIVLGLFVVSISGVLNWAIYVFHGSPDAVTLENTQSIFVLVSGLLALIFGVAHARQSNDNKFIKGIVAVVMAIALIHLSFNTWSFVSQLQTISKNKDCSQTTRGASNAEECLEAEAAR